MKNLTIIAAISENNVIGINGQLPWKIPEDLHRFKKLTMGNTIIMGRKTFESIGKPLPGRENIVLTRQPNYKEQGIILAHTIEEAIAISKNDSIYAIGGQEIYRATLPLANAMEITRVHRNYEGDTFFPEIDYSQWKLIDQEEWGDFSYMSYSRK
jgi:dihydrofolate reductase